MKSFIKLVELRTKVASLFPFLYGIFFSLWFYQRFNLVHTLLFFVTLLCIDMATTALNNWMDFKKDKLKSGYHYEVHNAIVEDKIPLDSVKKTIIGLLICGGLAGLYLAVLTDFWVLLIGLFSFAVGILYSSGPLPISRTPFGEFFSGVMMGFVIFFVSVYIQLNPPTIFDGQWLNGVLTVKLDVWTVVRLGIWSLPFVLGISSIMLANNLSDMKEDQINHRRTLPLVIGSRWGKKLLKGLYVLSLIQLCGLIGLGILPKFAVFQLVLYVPIFKRLKAFCLDPSKEKTFVLIVQAYSILAVGQLITMGMMILFK